MSIWALQIILNCIPLIAKLIDKWIPDKITRKKEFKTKRRVIDAMGRYHAKKKCLE